MAVMDFLVMSRRSHVRRDKNASVAAPKGIIFATIISGIVGFSFIIILLYVMGDNL